MSFLKKLTFSLVTVVFGAVGDDVFTVVGFDAVCFSGVVSVGFACASVIVGGINIVFVVIAGFDCSINSVEAKVVNKPSLFVLKYKIK